MSRLSFFALALLAGCLGQPVGVDQITSDSATLRSEYACQGDVPENPCTAWWQVWEHGATDPGEIRETPHATDNTMTSGFTPFSQKIEELAPDTVYHAQFCGFGSQRPPPGTCAGPKERGDYVATNVPGTFPALQDASAAIRFRTAGEGLVGTVDLGRLLSDSDTAETPIQRDAGWSAQLSATEALWLFADSARYVEGELAFFSRTGTAASGPYEAGRSPQELSELSPPIGPFLPAVTGLQTPEGDPCPTLGAYQAAWPSGLSPDTVSGVLLTWNEFCVEVTPNARFTPGRFRLATFAGGALGPLETVFEDLDGLPAPKVLGSPVALDPWLYLYGGEGGSAVYVARVPLDERDDPALYEWWTAAGWNSSAAGAENILTGPPPISRVVSVADFGSVGRDLVMIQQITLGFPATFRVLEASSPEGPWTEIARAKVPDPCDGGSQFGCYALVGHPEMSTSERLVFSWYSDTDRTGRSHIRVGGMDWP